MAHTHGPPLVKASLMVIIVCRIKMLRITRNPSNTSNSSLNRRVFPCPPGITPGREEGHSLSLILGVALFLLAAKFSGAAANSCASQFSVAEPGPGASPELFSAKYRPTSTLPFHLSVALLDVLNLANGLFVTVYADAGYSSILSNNVISLKAPAAPYLRSRLNVPSDVSFISTFRSSIMANRSSTCVVSTSRTASSLPSFAVQLFVFFQVTNPFCGDRSDEPINETRFRR